MSTLICNASIDYSMAKRIKAMGAEEFSALVTTLNAMGFTVKTDPDEWSDWETPSAVSFVTDIKALQADYPWLQVDVKRIRGQFIEGPPSNPKDLMHSTQITNISIPSSGLFAVQTVHWLEDACTETLQEYLNDGWRIVAVCPPNDTRRPTYILGHADKNRPTRLR